MPVLAHTARGERVAALLLPPLDREPGEQEVQVLRPVHGDPGPPGPLVGRAQQLHRESAARPQRRPDPRPHRGEPLGWDEEQGEARHHEVGRRQDRLLDRRGPQQETVVGRCRRTGGQLDEGLDPPVEGDHPPAPLEQRHGVPPHPAAQIERRAGWPAVAGEALERHHDGRARRPRSGEPVVGRERRTVPRHGWSWPGRPPVFRRPARSCPRVGSLRRMRRSGRI